jgi:hypothetical protein
MGITMQLSEKPVRNLYPPFRAARGLEKDAP